MGLYGKYTKTVARIAKGQMLLALGLLGLGIAFNVLVNSWIVTASFEIWLALWIIFSGLIGYASTRNDAYALIGYNLGFNSLIIIFASAAIFCHSLALVHIKPKMNNCSRSVERTNMTTNASTLTTTARATIQPTTTFMMYSTANSRTNSTVNPTNSTVNWTIASGDSDVYDTPFGATMICVYVIEIIMACASSLYSFLAIDEEPTGPCGRKIHGRVPVVQGTYSDVTAARNTPIEPDPETEIHNTDFDLDGSIKSLTTEPNEMEMDVIPTFGETPHSGTEMEVVATTDETQETHDEKPEKPVVASSETPEMHGETVLEDGAASGEKPAHGETVLEDGAASGEKPAHSETVLEDVAASGEKPGPDEFNLEITPTCDELQAPDEFNLEITPTCDELQAKIMQTAV